MPSRNNRRLVQLSETDRALMFPKLNASQIARLEQWGTRRHVNAGDVLFEKGGIRRNFYVLLEGVLEVVSIPAVGETTIAVYQPGDFSGEIDMLSGRPSL